jgi:hypothetical protein
VVGVSRLSYGLIALVALLSCRQPVPFFKGTVSHFKKHRSEIIKVNDEFMKSNFVQIYNGGFRGPIVARTSFDYPEEAITSDEGKMLRESLERAEVLGAYRDGADVYIDLFSQNRHGKYYLPNYHYRMGGSRNLNKSAEVSDPLKCGWCSAPIEDHWSVEVRWFPSIPEVPPSPECEIGTASGATRRVPD